jgi:hypothetical protein
VETASGTGWILRRFPVQLTGELVPAFSLLSRSGSKLPLLVRMIREAGGGAEEFVVEQVLRPYVEALAWLLFDQGLQWEGHAQNVLFEVEQGQLTGRMVLRDLSDVSVHVALRFARGRALPPLREMPAAPFPLASVACGRTADETVLQWGLRGFVEPVNWSLRRFFPRYRAARVRQRYLELWQEQCVRWLHVEPVINRRARTLPIEEALTCYLRQKDWRSAAVRDVVRCAWGEWRLRKGVPARWRPAF